MDARKALFVAAAFAPAVMAQGAAYAQCGGNGFSGAITCVSGYTCSKINDYYSQCVPGAAASTTVVETTAPMPTSTSPSATTTTAPVPTATSSSMTTSVTPEPTTTSSSMTTSGTPKPTATSALPGNPYDGVQLYKNPYYSSEVVSSAIPSLTGSLATKASAVAEVPVYMWIDTLSKVPVMDSILTEIDAANAAGASPKYAGQFVVYDLPDRDCAALASNGEYSVTDDGLAKYMNYIDEMVKVVNSHASTPIILVIEPDSLGNLVTNLNVPKCAEAQPAYMSGINYAITQLNLSNVNMYLDAGHAGWLGWPANLQPAATLFAKVYNDAEKPAAVRGLVTNVANYNAYTIASQPAYTQGDDNYDEELYINALAPLVRAAGFPASFITDTGRNGMQPTGQLAWGDWCNVIDTGFGVRPSTDTGNAYVDAFAWVKPGGECDGTSNSSATRYDGHCGLADALKPAPEAGTWFQAFFEQLLVNANPSF